MAANPGANGSILGNLAYILFLLIPGYVALRSYLYWSISIDSMNRLDKFATILLGGFLSLVSVVFVYRFGTPLVDYLLATGQSAFQDTTTTASYTPKDSIKISSVSNLSVVKSATIILLQSVVGTVLGAFYGKYHREVDKDPESREELFQPWERAYEISEIGDPVHIITTQNREISGKIQQMGSPSENFDILIAEPHEIIRDKTGEVLKSHELGQFSYHHYRDISRIEFGNSDESDIYDPDSQTSGINSIGEFTLHRTRAGFRTLKSFGSGFQRNITLSTGYINKNGRSYRRRIVGKALGSRRCVRDAVLTLAKGEKLGPEEPPEDDSAESVEDDLSFQIQDSDPTEEEN